MQKNNYKKLITICCRILVLLSVFYSLSFLCKYFQPYIFNIFTDTRNKLLLWLITVILSGLIPGPFMPLVIFCANTELLSGTTIGDIFVWTCFQNIILIWSAVIVGKIISYILGYKFGIKCAKWILSSEESYQEWQNKLNTKTGLHLYCLTVALPLFPDFLLAYIAGSLKLNFKIYLLINSFCKFIDILIVLILIRLHIL